MNTWPGGGVVVTNLGEEAVPFVTSQTADFHSSARVFSPHTFEEAEKEGELKDKRSLFGVTTGRVTYVVGELR